VRVLDSVDIGNRLRWTVDLGCGNFSCAKLMQGILKLVWCLSNWFGASQIG